MPLQHASLASSYLSPVMPSSSNWIAALHGISSREFSRAHSSAIRVRRVGGGRGQRRAFVRLQWKCFIRVRCKKKKGKQLCRRVLAVWTTGKDGRATARKRVTGARAATKTGPVTEPAPEWISRNETVHPPGGTPRGCDRAGVPRIDPAGIGGDKERKNCVAGERTGKIGTRVGVRGPGNVVRGADDGGRGHQQPEGEEHAGGTHGTTRGVMRNGQDKTRSTGDRCLWWLT